MRVAYFGNDIFLDCFQYLANGHRFQMLKLFSAQYSGQEYDLAQSTRRLAREYKIPVQTTPAFPQDLDALHQQGCEAIISAGYSHKIPNWSGSSIRYAINIHPSLLPRGAGPMPLPWAILKGLERTGVTIHKLTEIWDGGDILLQESFPLAGRENVDELLVKSQGMAVRLLDRFLDAPDTYWRRAIPQSPHEREYWPRLTPGDCDIDWSWELERIKRHLRIYRPVSPDGSIEVITDVETSRAPHPHAPGVLLLMDGQWRKVAAKDGIVSFRVRRKLNVFAQG